MVAIRWTSLFSILFVAAGCSSKENTPGDNTPAANSGPAVEVQPDGGEWKSFRDPEGKFSVLLPGEATKVPGSDGETSYAVELEQGGGYTVMHSTVVEGPAAEVEQRLLRVQADVVGKRKLLHEATVKVGDVPARDFAFVDEEGDAHYYRLLIVGPRLYQVMTVTEEGKFNDLKADRKRFLDSFELLE